jgi:Cys-tRNA(Pro)/Cys-tRNA(Cys) deacylase
MNLLSIKYLLDKNIPFEHRSFPTSTEKGAANVAQALGFRERQMVKTLIFESDKNQAALIMVGGDQSAISGHLKKLLGSRNISMCNPERVKIITGYPVGSIPPFHWQPQGFPTFLEASLLEEDLLGVGTGQWGEEILIAPQDLIKASNAKVVNLTDRDKPVSA